MPDELRATLAMLAAIIAMALINKATTKLLTKPNHDPEEPLAEQVKSEPIGVWEGIALVLLLVEAVMAVGLMIAAFVRLVS